MYTEAQKKFRARERLIVQRVFLADGDALVLPTRRLLAILSAIREYMPGCRAGLELLPAAQSAQEVGR
jgi:hypothetical protein